MKIYFLVALLLVALAAIMAAPADQQTVDLEPLPTEGEDGSKVRLICKVGEGVCGIYCIGIGKHGGVCKEGVCHCLQ